MRNYLSKVLHCDPMRITKKYTGNSSIGKRTFTPLMRTPENAAFIDGSQREMRELRRTWLSRLLLAEQWNNRKMTLMKASIAGHAGMYSDDRSSPLLTSANLNQAMNQFFGSADNSTTCSNDGNSTQTLSVREENVEKALKPYVKDPSEMTVFLDWLKNSFQLLNSSNPSLSDVNNLIEKGDNTIPALYKKMLSSARVAVSTVDATSAESDVHRENNSDIEASSSHDSQQDVDGVETGTTITDDSISTHDEVKSTSSVASSPSVAVKPAPLPVVTVQAPITVKSSSSRKRKAANQDSPAMNNAAVAARGMLNRSNSPVVEATPAPFNYAATVGSFGLPPNYYFGYPPQQLPYLHHVPTTDPPSYLGAPLSTSSGLLYPSYAEYLSAINSLHLAQQAAMFPPLDLGRKSTLDATDRQNLPLEDRIRAATLRHHVVPEDYHNGSFPYAAELMMSSHHHPSMLLEKYQQQQVQVPVKQASDQRPKKSKTSKTVSSIPTVVDHTHSLNSCGETTATSVMDGNDANNSSIVSAAEALLGLFSR